MTDQITIEPLTSPFNVTIRPPGSKSLTNRALLLAALADGTTTLHGVLLADDTQRMHLALRELGFDVTQEATTTIVNGDSGGIPNKLAEMDLGNAGTAYRFLTAACCLGQGKYRLDGIERMRQRPVGELVEMLTALGAQIDYTGEPNYPPLRIRGGELLGGELIVKPTLSSQYISAVLQVAPYCVTPMVMRFDGPITSQPYVEMTLSLMAKFGIQANVSPGFQSIEVEQGVYRAGEYHIEPDASNASYFLAAAAMSPQSRCCIDGIGFRSCQGDTWFAEVLQQMGAAVTYGGDDITVQGPKAGEQLQGIDIDLNSMPDMAQTLAVVALFAKGQTIIRNVGNLRVKETDRMAALETELTKLGAKVQVKEDDLYIMPPAENKLTPATIETYDDHRMAMSFSLAGLMSPGVVISDPACVNKTYPHFFEDLQSFYT